MTGNNYLFYSDYLKHKNLNNKQIMIAKTKKTYLIGPIIDHNFYENSFYRRIKSNSIYSTKIYKKMFKRKCESLIMKYKDEIKSNQVLELDKKGNVVLHSILRVPGEDNDKK